MYQISRMKQWTEEDKRSRWIDRQIKREKEEVYETGEKQHSGKSARQTPWSPTQCVCVCVCECWMLGNLRSSGWYLNAFILFAKWKMHVVFGRRSGHKFSAVWTYKSYSRWPVCVCVEWWNTHIHTMSVIHMHTLETFSLNTQQHLYLWKKERDVV